MCTSRGCVTAWKHRSVDDVPHALVQRFFSTIPDGTTDADAAVVALCSETETTKHLLLNYLQAAASTDPAADTAQTHLLCERRLEALALGDHAHEPPPLLLMAGASGTSERSSRSSPFSANSTRSCNVSPAARGEATASPSRVARSRQP